MITREEKEHMKKQGNFPDPSGIYRMGKGKTDRSAETCF